MDYITFILVGLFTGAMGGWAAFTFGTKTGKVVAGSASLSAVALETDSALEGFIGYGHGRGELVLVLSGAYVIGFFATVALLTQLLLRQESKYRITLIDVVFGNNKALDAYHDAKRRELDTLLAKELNIDGLTREREALDQRQLQLDLQARVLAAEREDAEALLQARDTWVKGRLSLAVPLHYKYPVGGAFLELLPRQVFALCRFYHALVLTSQCHLAQASTPTGDGFAGYLLAVAGCLKEHLFDQPAHSSMDEVRVYFRQLDRADMTYKACVVHGDTGPELPAVAFNAGLIKASRESRRSLVYSANRTLALGSADTLLWQDYLVYVIDGIKDGDLPQYSLGIAIRHRAAHASLLYLISFIRLEQVIEHELRRVHRGLTGVSVVV